MQIRVPASSSGVDEILEKHEVLSRVASADADQTVISLVIAAHEVEPIMDRLESRFAGVEGFSVVLVPVEAVLPRPKEPEADEVSAPEPKKGRLFRVSREELYAEITEGLDTSPIFLAMVALSTVVACVGLMRTNAPAIIGAMVIAPLLGPNVALALGTTLADFSLIRRALLTNGFGVLVALVISIGVGVVLDVDPTAPEIASRTVATRADILLASAAGAAGCLAVTSGIPGTLIGVMVAVALMPPLVTAGLLYGSGLTAAATGALLLTATNVVCVNLAGVATFLAVGVRPRRWLAAERARKGTAFAMVLWIVLLGVLYFLLSLPQA
jgi:uncharacterized hydrophobic protein (TIGR00341 family)